MARVALGWALLVALFGGFLALAGRAIGWRATALIVGITAAVTGVALLASWLITGSLS